MPKSRKPKPPASHRPWAAVILAIDPGADSGAAIFDHGKLLQWQAAKTYGGMKRIALEAHEHAAFINAPLVCVIESHSVWSGWSAKAREGVIENVGLWKNAIKGLPARRPTTKIVRVNVSTWRARMLGKSSKGEHRNFKSEALIMATTKMTIDNLRDPGLDHNTAEAILIGHWATRAGEVGALPGVKPI